MHRSNSALHHRNSAPSLEARPAPPDGRLPDEALAKLGHDIRAPLTAIVLSAEIIRERAPAEATRFARIIERSGQRILATLEAMLDRARRKDAPHGATRQRLDLGAEVTQTAALLAPWAHKKGLAYTVDVETAAADLCVWGDPMALQRILTNLISNAIRYTEHGEVAVRVRTDGPEAVIDVCDTGMGIPASFQERMFVPFQRSRAGREAAEDGRGLGLAIVDELVRALDGRIEVDSAEGAGSRFSVRLPLADAVPPRVAGADAGA